MNRPISTPTDPTPTTRLYQHVQRPEWGVAILVHDARDRRGYLFEDGEVRTFVEGFHHLVQPVSLEPAEAARRLAALDRRRSRRERTPKRRRRRGATAEPKVTFADQVRVLKMSYPDGFHDDLWVKDVRGAGASKRLKRHRDPAVAQARRDLSAERLDALVGAGRSGEVVSAVRATLRSTDLVTPKMLRPLDGLDAAGAARLAAAVRGALHGEGPFGPRLTALIDALTVGGREPAWQLVTALPALVHPAEHVCVKPSAFRQQAKVLAPDLRHGRAPGAAAYARYLELARTVEERLLQASLTPRDLLDVHDFMWATLRPKARRHAASGPDDAAEGPSRAAA